LVDVLKELGTFFIELLRALPSLLLRFSLAWIVSAAILVLGFGAVKNRLRNHVTIADNAIRKSAGKLRYGVAGDETIERDESSERVGLSWFFRFWTNFASAPSLSIWSLLVPFWLGRQAVHNGAVPVDAPFIQRFGLWLLPGLCYAGSMLLSFVLKRVFKRVRPPRKGFAFGHKLKDPSFPSGHSLTAFCFWMSLAATVVRWSGWSQGTIAMFCLMALVIVGLTGLSRVYLGVHFPSDVGGGYLIGLVWCVACFVALSPVLWPA